MAKEAIEVQDGVTIDYELTSDVDAGDVIALKGMIGIACESGLAGETIALKIEGVYEIAAKSDDAIEVGDLLYFDATNRVLTITDTGNTRAGRAVSAKAANTAGSVLVKLNVG